MESVKSSMALLHFDCEVYCKTDEEVKTLCTVLGFAEEWRVYRLRLVDKMGAEGWEALSKVADKGKVDFVRVSKPALRAANKQHVEALWRATDGSWWDYDSGRIIAKKSEGDAGLQKLLVHRGQEMQTLHLPISQNCAAGDGVGDADQGNRGKCCQLL